jgi:flagellar hook-associated protein 3 FlgL
MSGVTGVPAAGEYGLLMTLVANSAGARQRLDQLTQQASTGLKAGNYAGLGAGAPVSLDLNPQIASLQTWQDNIASATGRMGVTQATMTQIQQIASNFYTQINNLNGINTSEVDSIATSARDALTQVAGLLDAQDGGVFVFGGADTANPPVPSPGSILSSGFYTQIAAAVGNLGSAGAPATAAATLGIASSNSAGTSPFSAYMSQPASTLQAQTPAIQTGPGQSSQVGLLASANSAIASPAGSTTGSYMRDLMRSLATLGSLSSAQVNLPGFDDLIQDTRTSLQGAITAMAGDTGVLGNRQTALTAIQTGLAATQTALKIQVGATQDVDMAQTLSDLTAAQTQLQASYQVIAAVNGLSLAKLLPAGA